VFFRPLKPGKSFRTDAFLEYCKYQKTEGPGCRSPRFSNAQVRDKIRQQLQVLRNLKLLEFFGGGF
jgi:hypothetical protein